MTERERFEAWARERFGDAAVVRQTFGGDYVHREMDIRWEAWEAATAVRPVECP